MAPFYYSMSAPLTAATVATLAWIALAAYQFHTAVTSDGSWYNALKHEERDTYWNRVKLTVDKRIDLGWTILMVSSIALGVFVVTFVFVTGIMAL